MLSILMLACLKPAVLNDLPVAEHRTALTRILTDNQLKQGNDCNGFIKVNGVDKWHSTWMRKLTPLKTSEATFIAQWSTNTTAQNLNVESSAHYQFNVEQMRWIEMGRDTPLSNSAKIYIESLMLYLRVHFMASPLYNVEHQGEETIKGIRYERVFFTLSEEVPIEKRDHFRAYINTKTNLIDYVSFTYRDLYAAYKGVIKLEDYRIIDQRWHPHLIAIQDSIKSTKPVHSIILNNISCLLEAN